MTVKYEYATVDECNDLFDKANELHPRCLQCRYFKTDEPPQRVLVADIYQYTDLHGACHRFPPRYEPRESEQEDSSYCHPWVFWSDWCGEFIYDEKWPQRTDPHVVQITELSSGTEP